MLERWDTTDSQAFQNMFILQVSAAITVLFAATACSYHLFLATVALLSSSKRSQDDCDAIHTFAIIVPAHNEELGIGDTLQSCRSLDYPQEKTAVYVIADNCSDKTEQIALRGGAHCLVRHDTHNLGKGHALTWAIPQVTKEPWDAIIILDADCRLDADALKVFDSYFVAGDKVLQANYSVSNPDDSPISYVLAVANKLENELSDTAKSKLGLACFLRGTGMVLRRDVLQEIPWQAGSVVEDSEYSFLLCEAAIPVRFVSEVHVDSRFPSSRGQLIVQRMRWIAGIRVALLRGLRLFWEGIRRRRILLVDAGFSTLVAGRFLVLFEWAASFVLAYCCSVLAPSTFSTALLGITLAIGSLYIIYAAVGVYMVGLDKKRFMLLLQAPIVIFQYLSMAVVAIVFSGTAKWHRTPRAKTKQ